jgi:hypothetical protein
MEWSRRGCPIATVLVFAALATSSGAPAGLGGLASRTETLQLHAELRLVSLIGACPAGVTVPVCAARTGEGLVQGLGKVAEAYTFLAEVDSPPCGVGFGRALSYRVRFIVANKGAIDFSLASAECVTAEAVRTQTQAFTIVGGTGIYAGASGSGTVSRLLGGETPRGRVGSETWTGALVVPGLEFDVTPPVVLGAIARTIAVRRGAKSVRVTYKVTATDAVDGPVPPSCRPLSGTRFKVGRTRVTCTATDTSGNTATRAFTVIVKARP